MQEGALLGLAEQLREQGPATPAPAGTTVPVEDHLR